MIFSMSAALAGTFRGGAAQSYNSLLGARVVQGLGVATFESVMFALVGDLYFIHERGSRMAIVTTAISGISNLPAMLGGFITQNLGWRWMFWMLSIFLGIAWVAALLFGRETAFRRDEIYNLDTSSQDVGRPSLYPKRMGTIKNEVDYVVKL
jgi:MFS family permease